MKSVRSSSPKKLFKWSVIHSNIKKLQVKESKYLRRRNKKYFLDKGCRQAAYIVHTGSFKSCKLFIAQYQPAVLLENFADCKLKNSIDNKLDGSDVDDPRNTPVLHPISETWNNSTSINFDENSKNIGSIVLEDFSTVNSNNFQQIAEETNSSLDIGGLRDIAFNYESSGDESNCSVHTEENLESEITAKDIATNVLTKPKVVKKLFQTIDEDYLGLESQNSTNDSISQLDSDYSEAGCSSTSRPYYVAPSVNSNWTIKDFFCPFCKRKVQKFARHITGRHKNEESVQKILSYPVKSKERKLLIEEIRKSAQFFYNTSNKYNEGDLLVPHRPNSLLKRKVSDFLPCPNCRAHYRTSYLLRHNQYCTGSIQNLSTIKEQSKLLIEPHVPSHLQLIFKLLRKGKYDELTRVIKQDETLLLHGARLCSKYILLPHMDNKIRSHIRTLARLFLAMKRNPEIKSFKDCLMPDKMHDIVTAVYVIAGFNPTERKFKIPALALQIGGILTNCCDTLLIKYISEKNNEKKQDLETFKYLIKQNFTELLTSVGHANLLSNKLDKLSNIPINEDIFKLRNYLQKHAIDAYENLLVTYDYASWRSLAQNTLVLLMIFNRRRIGESQRLTIRNYETKSQVSKDSDLYNLLSDTEKKQSELYHRIEIRGKWGRSVPMLLSEEIIKFINMILKHRKNAGVSEKNPYVFGNRAGVLSHFFAGQIIREASNKCGARNPLSLRGTFLRKQFATVTQALDLSENDTFNLSNFMGHSMSVHNENYKKVDKTREVTKLSTILEAFNENTIEKHIRPEVIQNTSEDRDEDSNNHQDIYRTPTKSNKIFRRAHTTTNKIFRKTNSLTSQDGYRHRIAPKKTWSTPEKRVIRKEFATYLKREVLPTLEYCQKVKLNYPVLQSRSNSMIKAYINNQIRKTKNEKDHTSD